MLRVKVSGPRRIDIKIPARCPACGREIRISARTASNGRKIQCSCGRGSIQISGDGFRRVQDALDDMLRAVHRLAR